MSQTVTFPGCSDPCSDLSISGVRTSRSERSELCSVPRSDLPLSPIGERVVRRVDRTPPNVAGANTEHRTPNGLTSLYVSPTLLVFEEPHDQDGRCPLATDFTHAERTADGDGAWPFRRLDATWLGWLARVVERAGNRLSARQRAAWDQIQAWAGERSIRPSSPPPGYRPPVAFRGSMWRYDRERTDGRGIAGAR